MAFKTGLEGKPYYFGLGIGIVIFLALVILVYQLPVKKLKDEISKLDKELQNLTTEIQKGEEARKKLGNLQEEVAKLDKKLQELFIMLPTKKETHVILKRIKTLAEEGDFSFKSFVPSQNFNDREFYYEWPIQVSLEGTYHNLAIFFDKLRTLPRIINVSDMDIKAITKKGSDSTISTKITLLSYIYKEKEETPKTPQKPKGGKK
ncbi:MAG: type 4a pilus biogenesis protein PilO [Thermoanaerobaculia bacterium]